MPGTVSGIVISHPDPAAALAKIPRRTVPLGVLAYPDGTEPVRRGLLR
jgi:hypothetical protein